MSPLLKSVEKAGLRGLRAKRNPTDITAQDFFTDCDRLRQEFSELVNAGDPQRIAIIPSASYGITTAAKNINISRGQHVLVAAEQFPSNYYPWQAVCKEAGAEVKAVAPDKSFQDRGKRWNEKILESIDTHTRAVAIAHTHWADGTRFDLEAIRKRTRDVGALLIIDGTQSVGALPFDIQKIQPDALVCAGYKWLLGPYSIGLAYFGEYFNDGKPLEENWINRLNSEDFTSLVQYHDEYQPGALRFEGGEHSNFILVPMMLRALKQLNRWGVHRIQAYSSAITSTAIELLRAKGFWIEDAAYRAGHLFGIRPPQGVDIKAVQHTFKKNNIYVSFRGDAIRVSASVFNDESDLKKLVKSLRSQL